MTLEIFIVLTIIGTMMFCLIKEVTRPDFILFCALASLLLFGIITPSEAVKGFSNEAMLTVALLFIIAGAVQQSGFLSLIVMKSLGSGNNPRRSLFKMMVPLSGLSAFLNNTPIVVMFTPVIRNWCKKHKLAPSKFLIPLSYATIFGGTITLIGTSTNLLAHGLMIENGLPGYSMFQLAVVAIPGAIIGILFMSTIGYKLLPIRKSSEEQFQNTREFLSEMVVEDDAPIIGKTIEHAGLRNLTGLYLIEIIRNDGERVAPVTPHHKIKKGDRLIFTGMISTIVQLEHMRGVRVDPGSRIELEELKNGNQILIEAVISHQSTLVHKTIKQSKFRNLYGGGIIAVHRNQKRVNCKIGEIKLEPGDTLLILAGRDFIKRWSSTKDFYIIHSVDSPEVIHSKKTIIAISTLLSMVLLAAFNIMSMFMAAVLSVLVLFGFQIVTFDSVKKYVHFNVLMMIACSIGIGIALDVSGTASLLAEQLIVFTQGLGLLGMLIVLYLITNLFTEIVTNNAAVVIMFPIAMSAAIKMAVDPMAFFVTITIAASASFSTPIGYQTNLIVYGPGGYRFSDYLKVGLPLNILYLIVTVSISYFVWL